MEQSALDRVLPLLIEEAPSRELKEVVFTSFLQPFLEDEIYCGHADNLIGHRGEWMLRCFSSCKPRQVARPPRAVLNPTRTRAWAEAEAEAEPGREKPPQFTMFSNSRRFPTQQLATGRPGLMGVGPRCSSGSTKSTWL